MIENRIKEHEQFWNNRKFLNKPLVSFRLGSYFPATHYKAAKNLLVPGKKITPAMIDVDSFMEDYERKYNETVSLGQSGIWTAEPYTGIPWMEAFWGCEIAAGEESFTALPFVKEIKNLDRLQFCMDNPWVKKFFEFVKKLNDFSKGRFPVGAPIMRGQGDTVGALTGQTEFIYALYEEPEIIKRALRKVVDSFLEIYGEMHRLNKSFHGGSSMGFYHLWCPGKSIWFQDDISALLSPALYREFFLENEKYVCAKYKYTLMHLHPSSFHLLDDIMENENLKAIEINKDLGGPTIRQMLPQFKKVIDRNRRLVIWGSLTKEDIQLVLDELPQEGIFFHIVSPDYNTAEKTLSFISGV